MIPYPYNMVDFSGLDLATINFSVVDGIYNKIVEAIGDWGVAVFYNWFFGEIPITPQHCQVTLEDGYLMINGVIKVTSNDEVGIDGLGPQYVLVALEVTDNGEYQPSDYNADGFSSVTVEVEGAGVVLSGEEVPSDDVGEDEQLYVKYTQYSGLNYEYGIDAIYRKVNGEWVEYVDPEYPNTGVHLWTTATGGSNAAVDIQKIRVVDGQIVPLSEAVHVAYTSVSSYTDFFGLVSIRYSSGWYLKSLVDLTDGVNTYQSDSVISTWQYTTQKDIIVYKP